MGYELGVDLGTTYTAAAVCRGGRPEIVTLGNRTAAVPSVILLREDETVLVGDAASRRGITQPDRVAREFKRRLGDTTPLFLGGVPYSAEALLGKLLRWVVAEVSTREGGPPDHVAVSHPANWGAYKIDLLRNAVRLADLPDASFLTEPQAAAISYASQERVEVGSVVAVYDLGGGTFDAAVLRKTADGFEHLGHPEGIERLGGIDFDAAVFAHVQRSIGEALAALDTDDPTVLAALARLRADCAEAKEALSVDSDTSIPVLLPNIQTEVRLTRGEFESMVRPALADSVDALHRALRSAAVEPEDVSVVLLVGGSSRIPLVAQLVSAELGRPVAVDAHPKHSIALGAALAASPVTGTPAPAPPPATLPGPTGPSVVPVVSPSTDPVAGAAPPPPPPAAPPPAVPPPMPAPPPAPAVTQPVVAVPPAAAPPLPPAPTERPLVQGSVPVVPQPTPPPAPPPVPPPSPAQGDRPPAHQGRPPASWPSDAPPSPRPQPGAAGGRGGRRRSGPPLAVVVLGVLAVIAVAAAVVVVLTQRDEGGSLPPGCREGDFVCITDPPTVVGDDLVAEFDTDVELSEALQSIWFFDSDAGQVGGDSAAIHRLWTGGAPFTGFSAASAADAVERGAEELCVALADVSGSTATLRPDSGNCQPLPSDLTGG